MHQKIIDYQRHTVEFSSITPTRTTPPTSRTTPRRPDQPYQINPECQIQEFTREITIKKTIRSFPAPSNKGTRRSLNTLQTIVKSCHQQSHNRTISTSTSPHPPGAGPGDNTATTTPTTQIGLIQDSNRPTVQPRHGCVWWVNTTVRETTADTVIPRTDPTGRCSAGQRTHRLLASTHQRHSTT